MTSRCSACACDAIYRLTHERRRWSERLNAITERSGRSHSDRRKHRAASRGGPPQRGSRSCAQQTRECASGRKVPLSPLQCTSAVQSVFIYIYIYLIYICVFISSFENISRHLERSCQPSVPALNSSRGTRFNRCGQSLFLITQLQSTRFPATGSFAKWLFHWIARALP